MYHEDKVEYAWLSSYNVKIFFYMKKGTRILYMSDQYDMEAMVPLFIYAWFCRAHGLIEEELFVPTPNEKYFYLNDPNPNHAGLVTL